MSALPGSVSKRGVDVRDLLINLLGLNNQPNYETKL